MSQTPQDFQDRPGQTRATAAPLPLGRAAPVVVFDSGVGGLSVLRCLMAELSSEPLVYLADSAWVPYGDKPQEVIAARSMAVARFAHDTLAAKALVIACNTATAAAVAQIRAQWPDWVVVGIEPAVKPAAMSTRSGVVGILATTNTLASEKFRSLVQGFSGDCRVLAQPCPGLVECIESGDLEGPGVRQLLHTHVQALCAQGADVIVLGCTHYPFVAPLVAELAGPGVTVLETGEAVARETRRRLAQAGLLCDVPGDLSEGGAVVKPTEPVFLSTGTPELLEKAVRRLLGLTVAAARVTC